MHGPILLVVLAGIIVFIVLATAKLKLHPFLALLISAIAAGLIYGLPPGEVVTAMVKGFGGTLGYIGIVIAAGTVIGQILEKSGATHVMAQTVLRLVGKARSALAMAVTGAVVSIPVFCDSGFVILSPLNRSLAKESGQSLSVLAMALALGLYTTHVFVPPTPGPIAAAGALHVDLGVLIPLGLLVSAPCVIVSWLYARFIAGKVYIDPDLGQDQEAAPDQPGAGAPHRTPSVLMSFAPIIVPVLLISLKSIADYPTHPLGQGALAATLQFIGDPRIALLLGVLLAFATAGRLGEEVTFQWVDKGLTSAGLIILITGAGGALGAVLRASPLQDYLGQTLGSEQWGLVLPFLLAAALKTAQGSSTVSIITTASIIAPTLPAMGLDQGVGPALAVLAIGAGAMTVSHANDSYFWVVARFSGMTTAQAYRLMTVGTLVLGIAGILSVLALSLIML